MTQTFTCGDHGALVSYLYDECEPSQRRAISAHVAVCGGCAEEIASLGATRELLGAWSPPDAQLGFRVVSDAPRPNVSNVLRPSRWWQQPMPAWAQAAAAAVIFATGVTLGALRGTTATTDAPTSKPRGTNVTLAPATPAAVTAGD
jgi:anti-sigma factor RsiW